MTKRRITSLMAIIVCAIFILPLTLNLTKVKADSIVAYQGVDFTLETSGAVKGEGSKVEIAVEGGSLTEAVTLYKNGNTSDYKDGATAAGIIFTSYTSDTGVMKMRFAKVGDYIVKVTTLGLDPNVSQSFNVKISTDIENEAFTAPKYEVTDAKRQAYQAKVDEATFIKSDDESAEKVSLYVGDTYEVPSVEDLISDGSFAYSLYKKTIYYAGPGSSTYSSTTSTSFTISEIGGYRFYVVLTLDPIDGKTFNINTLDTVEHEDGFYSVKAKADGKVLKIEGSGDSAKYYYLNAEDEKVYVEKENTEKGDLIVPIFEFTILNAGPKIEIKESVDLKAYIGLQYTVKSITVTGSDVTTTYTLLYSENKNAAESEWVEAEEDYNTSTHKFTPAKQGYYKVKVEAVDTDGKSAIKYTSIITVTEKLQKVEYETSFKNWLSVNKTPFIFLCISAFCLIVIVAIIFVPATAFSAMGAKIKGVAKIFKKRERIVEDDEEDDE